MTFVFCFINRIMYGKNCCWQLLVNNLMTMFEKVLFCSSCMVNSFVFLVHFKSMCIWMIHQLKLTYTEYRFGLKGQAIYSSQSSRWRLSGSRLIRNIETSGWITSEMLTSGKLKSGDFFFDQHLPPKWICQLAPPPQKKILLDPPLLLGLINYFS